jgi:hypothetical protein
MQKLSYALLVLPLVLCLKKIASKFITFRVFRLPHRIRLLSLLALCFVFLPLLRASRQSDAPRADILPTLTAYNLDKAKVNLPTDLEGKVNLLLISFEPEQSKDIDTWMPAAQAIQHMNFLFNYYKMPVSSQENFIYRWWDTSSLRSVETDPLAWHWIIPLYTNKDTFRRALNIPNEKEIVLVLVDKKGQVLWKTSGRMTDEKKSSLTNAVAAATHLQ